MSYIYETHLHTNIGSKCGRCNPEDYIEPYMRLGFTGIIVTDHFFNGNSSIDPSLPWKEKVRIYCLGYEKAQEAGYKRGFSVFFGWEHNFQADEFLVYGLDKQWLLDHPEVMQYTRKQLYENATAAGGAVVQAHPFRERDYIEKIRLWPDYVTAIEAFNKNNSKDEDLRARAYARKYNLIVTAGSDVHTLDTISDGAYGVVSDVKWNSIADYVHMLQNHIQPGLHIEKGKDIGKPMPPHLPVELTRDK